MLAWRTWSCRPKALAAACIALDWVSATGPLGLTSRAMTFAVGISSCSNSNRFGKTSMLSWTAPVTLPPGWRRLVTRLSWTGLLLVVKTIGTVVVAALAANAAGVLVAAMTVT